MNKNHRQVGVAVGYLVVDCAGLLVEEPLRVAVLALRAVHRLPDIELALLEHTADSRQGRSALASNQKTTAQPKSQQQQ